MSPTNLADEIREHAYEIVKSTWPEGKPIRMLTVTGINLVNEDEGEQLTLFSEENDTHDKSESVERAMDEIRKKFGDSSIKFGRVIGNDIGVDL